MCMFMAMCMAMAMGLRVQRKASAAARARQLPDAAWAMQVPVSAPWQPPATAHESLPGCSALEPLASGRESTLGLGLDQVRLGIHLLGHRGENAPQTALHGTPGQRLPWGGEGLGSV